MLSSIPSTSTSVVDQPIDLPQPVVVDFRDPDYDQGTHLTLVRSEASIQHTVIDNDGLLNLTRTNEVRRNGLRRVEQLLSNAKWAGGNLPTSWAQPGGSGTSTVAVASDYGNDATAIEITCSSNQGYLALSVSLLAGYIYTLSVLIEATGSLTPANQLLNAVLPAGATITCPGNAIVGQRVFATIQMGATSGIATLRVGLGALSSTTGFVRMSRPMLTVGEYFDEQGKWVDDAVIYNAGVAGVRYFNTDRAGALINRDSISGLAIFGNATHLNVGGDDPNEVTWGRTGLSVSLSNKQGAAQRRAFSLNEDLSTGKHSLSGAFNATSGKWHSLSVIVGWEEGAREWVALTLIDYTVFFNVRTGAHGGVTGAGAWRALPLGNGLVCVQIATLAATTQLEAFELALAESDGGVIYTGSGSNLLFTWLQVLDTYLPGAHFVKGLASTAAPGDQAVLDAGALGINATQGILAIEYETSCPPVSSQGLFSLEESTAPSQNRIDFDLSGSVSHAMSYGAAQSNLPSVAASILGRHRLAIAYEAGNRAISVDGSSPVIDNTYALPETLDQLVIGALDSDTQMIGFVRRIIWYPESDTANLATYSTF